MQVHAGMRRGRILNSLTAPETHPPCLLPLIHSPYQMHLLKPLASFLAASAFTNASMSSNLPKPLSNFLAAGSSAFEKGVGEGHKLAATYGPQMLEKMEEATRNVCDSAAAYGPPVWEKAEEITHNVRRRPPFICNRLLMLHSGWSVEC